MGIAQTVMSTSYDMLMKLVIVGESGTGKSCVISRFCDDEFSHITMSTIGVDFRIKLLDHHSKLCKLQMWDTAGQERFRSLTGNYYKSADAVILTYDVTDMETLQSLETTWLPEVRRLAPTALEEDRNILVLGTKMDFGHAMCSSLTGANIESAIETFVHKVADSESPK